MKLIVEVSEKDYKDFLMQYNAGVLDKKTPSHRAKIAIAKGIEQKVGKWIYCGDEESGIPLPYGNGRYKCPLCNHTDIHSKTQGAPFCWFCGAKMEGAEEC